MYQTCFDKGSRKVVRPLRPLAPLPRLSGHRNGFKKKILHNFWTKRAIFLGKYFKKPVKYCEFDDRQHNTLIQ